MTRAQHQVAWCRYRPDADAIYRRASGRRHYNSIRTLRATLRQLEVVRLMVAAYSRDPFAHGAQAAIARQLGVSRSTVCRDLRGAGLILGGRGSTVRGKAAREARQRAGLAW